MDNYTLFQKKAIVAASEKISIETGNKESSIWVKLGKGSEWEKILDVNDQAEAIELAFECLQGLKQWGYDE